MTADGSPSPPSWLIRLPYAAVRPHVWRLRTAEPARRWRFAEGIAVIDSSLSDALKAAIELEARE
jgi:hypothetical protein